jgi:hypothetical protein
MLPVNVFLPNGVPGVFVDRPVETLQPFERRVLVAIDGQRTVGAIAQRFGAQGAAAERLLRHWHALGALAFRATRPQSARLLVAGGPQAWTARVDEALWRAWGEPQAIRVRRPGVASLSWRLRPQAALGPRLLLPSWWLRWRRWPPAALVSVRPAVVR